MTRAGPQRVRTSSLSKYAALAWKLRWLLFAGFSAWQPPCAVGTATPGVAAYFGPLPPADLAAAVDAAVGFAPGGLPVPVIGVDVSSRAAAHAGSRTPALLEAAVSRGAERTDPVTAVQGVSASMTAGLEMMRVQHRSAIKLLEIETAAASHAAPGLNQALGAASALGSPKTVRSGVSAPSSRAAPEPHQTPGAATEPDSPKTAVSRIAEAPAAATEAVKVKLRGGQKALASDDDSSSSLISQLLPVAASATLWLLLTFVFAMFYVVAKPHPPEREEGEWFIEDRYWNFHFCQCMHEPRLTLFTCFCGAVRWADNMRMAKFLGFWKAFLLISFLSFLIMVGLVVFIPVVLFVAVYFRQQMRKLFDMPYGDCGTITSDCCAYGFCSVCAIVQEARQIEVAYKAHHRNVHPAPDVRGLGRSRS